MHRSTVWELRSGRFSDQKRGEQADESMIDAFGTSGKGSCVCVSSF